MSICLSIAVSSCCSGVAAGSITVRETPARAGGPGARPVGVRGRAVAPPGATGAAAARLVIGACDRSGRSSSRSSSPTSRVVAFGADATPTEPRCALRVPIAGSGRAVIVRPGICPSSLRFSSDWLMPICTISGRSSYHCARVLGFALSFGFLLMRGFFVLPARLRAISLLWSIAAPIMLADG